MLDVYTNVSVSVSVAALVFILLPQLVFICKKCNLLNMSPGAIGYCYYTIKINVASQNNI